MTPEQALKILTALSALPPGDGFSVYHDEVSETGLTWTVAYKAYRFHGEDLLVTLRLLVVFLEMHP